MKNDIVRGSGRTQRERGLYLKYVQAIRFYNRKEDKRQSPMNATRVSTATGVPVENKRNDFLYAACARNGRLPAPLCCRRFSRGNRAQTY